jgi:septal ring factor EnvC (AmiA/AmiB activator)
MSPTTGEAVAKTGGGAAAAGGTVLLAAQDVVAGVSVGAVTAALMLLSGALINIWGRIRQARREDEAAVAKARRADAEADALLRKRLEEIDSGSLTRQMAEIRAKLEHADERIEDANRKLRAAVSDRNAMQLLLAEQAGEIRTLRKQLGLPAEPDPEADSDERETLPKDVKKAAKDAIRESDDEIPAGEWPRLGPKEDRS